MKTLAGWKTSIAVYAAMLFVVWLIVAEKLEAATGVPFILGLIPFLTLGNRISRYQREWHDWRDHFEPHWHDNREDRDKWLHD